MFTKVHHVTYIVESIEDMADYMEKNFGMKPTRTDEITDRGYKSIMYQIGETMVDFFEPTRDDTAMAHQLKEQGPCVAHVAWGVDGIDQVFDDLKGKGNDMRGAAPTFSPFGYRTLSIEPGSSHGIYFQLAEGDVTG